MTVTRDPTYPRIIVVTDGDESERAMWIKSEIVYLQGIGKLYAHIREGIRIDDLDDTRTESAICTDESFTLIFIEHAN